VEIHIDGPEGHEKIEGESVKATDAWVIVEFSGSDDNPKKRRYILKERVYYFETDVSDSDDDEGDSSAGIGISIS
jgi:hypothetical protein